MVIRLMNQFLGILNTALTVNAALMAFTVKTDTLPAGKLSPVGLPQVGMVQLGVGARVQGGQLGQCP
mgnify:CR=1 FL=1